ncbi:MAG TPA: alpha/beta fold hydrolase [Rubrobacteraceae bacterium]|nr:alpha/beta fold hydrolase [Rubrobacteraceae bacterium]
MRRAVLATLVGAALLVAAYMGVGLLVALRLSAPERSPEEGTPADVGLRYRDVGFESEDGVPLRAWWVEKRDAERAAILVHGFGGNRSEEHILKSARIYASKGYSVLMLDLRGHGASGGERRTLGYREVRDVRAALSWLEQRGYGPHEVVLHGWSMGAATVVRAAPGTGVAAVVEDSGYADLPLLLGKELPENSGLPSLFNPGIMLSAKLFLGFDPWSVVPANEAAQLRRQDVPLLVIHSTTDETVAYEHARIFLRADPRAELWRLEGYDHVQSYTNPDYRKKLTAFLDRTAPQEDSSGPATLAVAGP